MKKFYNPLPNGDDQRNGDQFDDDQFNNDGHFETEKTAFWRPNGTGVSLVNTISLKAWVKMQTLKIIAKKSNNNSNTALYERPPEVQR